MKFEVSHETTHFIHAPVRPAPASRLHPGPSGSSQEEGLTVLATTYPVYLFARTVAQGVEGVTVERLNTGSVSCLHDYTLSVDDMKKIEGADVIAMNGAGLEGLYG